MKMRKLSSILFSMLLLSCLFSGAFGFYKTINDTFSSLRNSFDFNAATVINVNGFIRDIASTGSSDKAPSGQKETKKVFNFLFFLMGAVVLSGEKFLVILMLSAFAFFNGFTKKNLTGIYRINRPPDDYYLWWILNFLSPVQKCISNLADKYDMNPLYLYGRVDSNPAL